MCECPVALWRPAGQLWSTETDSAQQILHIHPLWAPHAEPSAGPESDGYVWQHMPPLTVVCRYEYMTECVCVCVFFVPVAAWKMPVKITPEAMSVSLLQRISHISSAFLFIDHFYWFIFFLFSAFFFLSKYQHQVDISWARHCCFLFWIFLQLISFSTSDFVFSFFRVSNYCRSKRCLTQTASLQTRRPGQYGKVLTGEAVARQLSTFSCNTAVVGHMGRLDETHSPTKKLPPESTPQVMFTGFEPTQAQQYTKVTGFYFCKTPAHVWRRSASPRLRLQAWWCMMVCTFLCHSGFTRWEVK